MLLNAELFSNRGDSGRLVYRVSQRDSLKWLVQRGGSLQRNAKELDRKKLAEAMNEAAYTTWFEREELFVKRLAVFDAACQMIGFLIPRYMFWAFTRSLWLSLVIGFVYPITAYFGMTRGKSLESIKQIRAKKQEPALWQ